jgi:hypothetical protein
MPKVVIRHDKAKARLSCGNKKYWEEFLPLLEVVELGPRSGGVTEDSLDRLIESRIRRTERPRLRRRPDGPRLRERRPI